jgi:4-aminobutyrate aminotransferase
LILDEIPIAFGRTGKMFCFEHFGIEPDMVCLGKGLGGGIVPMAALVARDEYNIASDVSLGHFTHEKSPLGCVAGKAVIDYIEQYHILDKVADDERFMRNELMAMKDRHPLIGDVRGLGLLWGIELVKNRTTKEKAVEASEKVMYACMENGLSFKVSQGNVIQLSPPLVITRPQLQEALGVLDKAIGSVQV